ncbi:MAG: hypothetical protein Fur0016_11700 [Anaerolineales bacterium]
MIFIERFRRHFDPTLLAFTILLAWLVLLVLSQANPYLTEIGRDNGFFLYAGARLLAGDVLYIDIWDHKGPLIFFINALGLALIKNSRWGVWALEFLFIFSAFYIGYLAIRKKWGVAPAITGALTALLALYNVFGRGNLTEEYPLLFNFIALALFFRHEKKWEILRSFLIGVMFSLAFLFRANNGGIPISIGLAILIAGFWNKNFAATIKNLVSIAFGALTVLFVTTISFYINGNLDAMIGAAFTYNLLDTAGQLNVISGLQSGWNNLGVASYLLLAGYASAIYKTIQSVRQKQTQGKDFELLILLILAWPVEVILSSLSGLNFVHYFICWVPAAFLLGSFAYHALSEHLFAPRVLEFMKTARANYLTLIVTMLFSYSIVFDYGTTFQAIVFNRQSGIDKSSRLADFIRETTAPSDRVLVWGGEASLNFMTRRASPTRYNLFSRLLSDHPMNIGISETFYSDVISHPPELIVDMWKHSPDYVPAISPFIRDQQKTKRLLVQFPAYGKLLDYIDAHYDLETRIEGYEIYRLKK